MGVLLYIGPDARPSSSSEGFCCIIALLFLNVAILAVDGLEGEIAPHVPVSVVHLEAQAFCAGRAGHSST